MDNLRRQGYDAFCPLVARSSKSDLARIVESPLFPCYVFVRFDARLTWHSINSTYGVIRLLTDQPVRYASGGTARRAAVVRRIDPHPLFVPEENVRELRTLSAAAEDPLPPGTLVRVRARGNPFYEQVGTVGGMDKMTRITVMMSILSRDVEIKFDLVELEKIED